MRKFAVILYSILFGMVVLIGVMGVSHALSCSAGQYESKCGGISPLPSRQYYGWIDFPNSNGWMGYDGGNIIHNEFLSGSGYSITVSIWHNDYHYYYDSGNVTFTVVGPSGYSETMYPGDFVGVWTSGDFLGVVIGEASCSSTSFDNTYAVCGGTSVFDGDGDEPSGFDGEETITGKYCWCRARKYNTTDISGLWVRQTTYSGADQCREDSKCVYSCATHGFEQSADLYKHVLNVVPSCQTCPDASGFYTGSTGTAVPTVANGSISSRVYSYEETEITDCYAKTGVTFHDDIGTFTFAPACYYTK